MPMGLPAGKRHTQRIKYLVYPPTCEIFTSLRVLIGRPALIGLLLLIPGIKVSAQVRDGHAVVNYVDGSKFIGKIVFEDEENLMMVASTGDTLHFKRILVKNIRRPADIVLYNNGKFHWSKGPFATATFGFTPSAYVSNHVDLVVGYKFSQRYAAGVGVGFESNDVEVTGLFLFHDFVSLFGYGRYSLGRKNARFFVDAKLGYGFANEDIWFGLHEFTGGIHLRPGIGMLLASRNSFRLLLGIHQYIQRTSGKSIQFDFNGSQIEADYSLTYNRTVIRLAVEFR